MDIQETTNIPEVKDTIVMLRQLSGDEKIKEEAYYREKRLHDEASALAGARREGRAEGRMEEREALIEKLRRRGFSEKEIKDFFTD